MIVLEDGPMINNKISNVNTLTAIMKSKITMRKTGKTQRNAGFAIGIKVLFACYHGFTSSALTCTVDQLIIDYDIDSE